MKIAMANADLPSESKGGVPHQAHYLANAMVEHGHEVTMFTFSPRPDDALYGVHQYPAPEKWRALRPFFLARELARTDFSGFDLVHTHGDNFLLRHHPQVRTFHGAAIDEMQNAKTWKYRAFLAVIVLMEKIGARRADVSTGVSEATRARFPSLDAVVPCGVDTARFRPGQKSPHPTILFVGPTQGRKRGDLLAEVFQKEIRPRIPNAELWLVTETPIEGEGIRNFSRVPLEQIVQMFQQAWVFCLPSTYEGFGVPYVEAMASGTAVTASPNPGALEVLQNGEFGVISPDEQLGASIISLLENPASRARYETKGLQRAQDYSWDTVVRAYEALYSQLLKRGAALEPAPKAANET